MVNKYNFKNGSSSWYIYVTFNGDLKSRNTLKRSLIPHSNSTSLFSNIHLVMSGTYSCISSMNTEWLNDRMIFSYWLSRQVKLLEQASMLKCSACSFDWASLHWSLFQDCVMEGLVKMRLHAEKQLPSLSGSGLTFCAGGGVEGKFSGTLCWNS
jgi:hypothetical protein